MNQEEKGECVKRDMDFVRRILIETEKADGPLDISCLTDAR